MKKPLQGRKILKFRKAIMGAWFSPPRRAMTGVRDGIGSTIFFQMIAAHHACTYMYIHSIGELQEGRIGISLFAAKPRLLKLRL